jgi:hypothetical protein
MKQSMNRMFSSGKPEHPPTDAVCTTIVGGRPPVSGRLVRNIPRGLEVLVKKAAIDQEFRELLVQNRSQAANRIGLVLDATEAAVIDSLPEPNLISMIEHAEVPASQRGVFLGWVAALMLAAIGGLEASTGEIVVTGILPDRPGVKPILSWDGSADFSYDVYYSDDLKTWTFLVKLVGSEGVMTYTDREANWQGVQKRFYKVIPTTLTRGIAPDKPLEIKITCEKIPGEG